MAKYLYLISRATIPPRMTTKTQLYLKQTKQDLFQVVDIQDITLEQINQASVVFLDFFASNMFESFKINKTKWVSINGVLTGRDPRVKMCLCLRDIHNYTFHPKTGYNNLLSYLKNYNIEFLASVVGSCPELSSLLATVKPYVKMSKIIPWHLPTGIFTDYAEPKIYDILIYGNLYSHVYPFRARLAAIIKKNKIFTVRHIPTPSTKSTPAFCEEKLAKVINQSWLTIATPSKYDYLVRKYFEASACKSVIAGNMPRDQDIWNEGDYIRLDPKMSNERITQILTEALNDKQKLTKISDHMYEKLQKEYSYRAYCDKLFTYMCEIDQMF